MDSANEEKEQGVAPEVKLVSVNMEYEKSKTALNAEMALCDPSAEQAKEDAYLLKEVGDSYARIQKGCIISSDGETKIPVDLTFIRTRNKTGGVDVICQVPALGMSGDNTLG